MIITNSNHMIIKNRFGKEPMALKIFKIFMVRITYSSILSYHTLVNIPVVVTSFSLLCRMKEDFMELYLVREQFQSDTCLVRYSKLVVYTFLSICKMRIISWSYNW